ncbi:hypothetical protein MAM1_0320c09638 [Mucor ambiguus]|uniref:RING-type domain-containing protein n=1 Tax=Mucor ambiguus TaxID=91626 RepID=A0A0C9N250_9FUNG|nr:hypothetical protein MAM1_0320c09638 [Mucor ambiguus]
MTNDTAIVALPCGHCFGEQCIEECLLSGSTKCPLCQKSYRHTHVRTLYLPLEEDCDKVYKEKYDELVKKTDDLTKHYEVLKDLCDMTASNAPIVSRVNELVNRMAIAREELKGKAIIGKGSNQTESPALEPKQKKKGKLCKLFAGIKL